MCNGFEDLAESYKSLLKYRVCVFQGSESDYAEMKSGVNVAYLDMQLSR